MPKFLFLSVFSLFILACGETHLDTSSDQAFSSTLDEIYQTIPESERESFLDYLNIIIIGEKSSFFSLTNRYVPKYDEFKNIYSMTKAFGEEHDLNSLTRLNGMTKAEIINLGKEIVKNKTLDYYENQRNYLNKEIDETINLLNEYQKFISEQQKVKVELKAVEVKEGFNFENKPWGFIRYIIAFITIHNGSSKIITDLGGKVYFYHGSNTPFANRDLNYLLSVDQPDDSYHKPFEIQPNTVWQGKVVIKTIGPDRNHPYPPKEQYTATISDIKVSFEDNDSILSRKSQQLNDKDIEKLKKAINDKNQELIDLERQIESVK